MWRRFRPFTLPAQTATPSRSEPEAASPSVVRESPPGTPEVSYLLLHTETRARPTPARPADSGTLGWCGAGWTLVTCEGDQIRGSTRLEAHGAGFGAAPGAAQAVATRVLAEQGVEVAGWDPPAGSVSFVATHRPSRLSTVAATALPGLEEP